MMLFINKMFYCCNFKIKFYKNVTFSTVFVVVKITERRKTKAKNGLTSLLFIYFITVNKYRFCISVIRYNKRPNNRYR